LNRSSPLVSIVILNFNGADYLENCLRSVLQTAYPQFEVILIDNASTDDSFEDISRVFGFHPNLFLLKNERNLGFAQGNNLGASMAKGKYVVFLNNDTEICPDWLQELVKVMESNPIVGAAQSKLLSFDKKTFDGSGDLVTVFGDSFPRGRFEKDEGQFNKVEEVFAARGAAMIIRRDLFRQVGGFDRKFFLTSEDTDLSWRIRLRGAKIFYVPTSVAYHAISGSSRKSFQQINHGFKNKIMMIVKNYDIGNLIRCLPHVAISECLSLLASLVDPNKRLVELSTFRATFWLAANFKAIWQERLKIQDLIRKVPDKDLKALMIKKSLLPFMVRWYFSKRELYRNDFFAFVNSQLYASKYVRKFNVKE
jgi:GT2 family glycosyltransferase